MQPFRCLNICSMCRLWRGILAQPEMFSVQSDRGPKLPRTTARRNPLKSRGRFAASSVQQVLSMCRLSQIAKAVIGRVAIDVVELLDRPTAISQQPRDAMALKMLPAKADVDISLIVRAAGPHTSPSLRASVLQPYQEPCIRIVLKIFSYFTFHDFPLHGCSASVSLRPPELFLTGRARLRHPNSCDIYADVVGLSTAQSERQSRPQVSPRRLTILATVANVPYPGDQSSTPSGYGVLPRCKTVNLRQTMQAFLKPQPEIFLPPLARQPAPNTHSRHR